MKYALIGLAPYTFQFDESKGMNNLWSVQYLIAFNDTHNLWLSKEQYKSLFNEYFLSSKIPLEGLDTNNVYWEKTPLRFLNYETRLNSRKRIEEWSDRNFPETVAENRKILDDYLTLCEENNIRPIMFLPPMTEGYKKYFSKQKLDEFYFYVRESLKKHSSAVFLDGWQLDFGDENFFDVDHMNIMGAARFSAVLNNFIEELEK